MAVLKLLLVMLAFAGLGLSGAHVPATAAVAAEAAQDHEPCHAEPAAPEAPPCCPDGCDGGCLAPAAVPASIIAAAPVIARSPRIAARETIDRPVRPARMEDPPRPFAVV